MALFTSPNPNVEVFHDCVYALINCMKRNKDQRSKILDKYHLLDNKEWFSFQTWLDAFNEISQEMGERNLFLVGVTFINKLNLSIDTSLEDALNFINIAYHCKHRIHGVNLYDSLNNKTLDGIGDYTVLEFDEVKKQAIIKSTTPYPSKFDEGVIYEVARKYKPDFTRAHIISIDKSQERRDMGGNSCTYILTW